MYQPDVGLLLKTLRSHISLTPKQMYCNTFIRMGLFRVLVSLVVYIVDDEISIKKVKCYIL